MPKQFSHKTRKLRGYKILSLILHTNSNDFWGNKEIASHGHKLEYNKVTHHILDNRVWIFLQINTNEKSKENRLN
jgi:hypothetical protein